MNTQFPAIAIEGDYVRATDHVEKGTALIDGKATVIAVVGILAGILATFGVGLIVLFLYPLFAAYMHRKAVARMHGSGVLVSNRQFPEIHHCLLTFQKRLRIKKNVSIYIGEGTVFDTFVVKYGRRNVILLSDELVDRCITSANPSALAFIIGHETGHIALKHTTVFRTLLRQFNKKLSRLDEYSADAVATALVGDPSIAYTGLLLLTISSTLLPYVSPENVILQAQEVAENKYTEKTEYRLSHPLLFNRLHRVLKTPERQKVGRR